MCNGSDFKEKCRSNFLTNSFEPIVTIWKNRITKLTECLFLCVLKIHTFIQGDFEVTCIKTSKN